MMTSQQTSPTAAGNSRKHSAVPHAVMIALHLNGILQNPYAAASATILRVACNITGNREKRRRDNLSFLRFSVVKTHFRVNHNQPWL